MIIIFIGPPGAGKGTQAKRLSDKLQIPYFSMGQLLREAYESGIPEGKEAWENYSAKGTNVPIPLKFRILEEQMEAAKTGFILDNFPRNIEDLEAWKEYSLRTGRKAEKVFHLVIPDETCFQRVQKRVKHELNKRGDDDLNLLKTRIEEGYRKELTSILDFFHEQKVLVEIDGTQSVDVVTETINKNL